VTELLGLEHDEVLVERLQEGVAEAGAAIEEASLAEVEQQEPEQRAGGETIEERLLVRAAAMEVRLGEGGAEAEGGAWAGCDLEGFEGAALVVALEPVADALLKG
jgi:hypothetical protein